jgi:hypothetical protein
MFCLDACLGAALINFESECVEGIPAMHPQDRRLFLEVEIPGNKRFDLMSAI